MAFQFLCSPAACLLLMPLNVFQFSLIWMAVQTSVWSSYSCSKVIAALPAATDRQAKLDAALQKPTWHIIS